MQNMAVAESFYAQGVGMPDYNVSHIFLEKVCILYAIHDQCF